MRESLLTLVEDLRAKLIAEQQAILKLKLEIKSREEGIGVMSRALEQIERMAEKVPPASRAEALAAGDDVAVTRVGGDRLLKSTIRNADRLAEHLKARGDSSLSKLQSENILSYQSVRNIVRHFPTRFQIRRDGRGRELVHLLSTDELPMSVEPPSAARVEAEKLFSG